jgi:hypothetical protein
MFPDPERAYSHRRGPPQATPRTARFVRQIAGYGGKTVP